MRSRCVVTNKKVEYLIEVKAIGLGLNAKHARQAVNYASREGIQWVVLTNGIQWEIYRVSTDGKVTSERLFSFDFTEMNPREKEQQDLLFLLCKKGIKKNLIGDYYRYRQSVNRHTIGALLLTDKIATVLRAELRKLCPDTKVNIEEVKSIVENEIIRREVHESEAGLEANKLIAKLIRKQAREKEKTKLPTEQPSAQPKI